MAVYKDGDKWRVIYRYTNYNGVYMGRVYRRIYHDRDKTYKNVSCIERTNGRNYCLRTM